MTVFLPKSVPSIPIAVGAAAKFPIFGLPLKAFPSLLVRASDKDSLGSASLECDGTGYLPVANQLAKHDARTMVRLPARNIVDVCEDCTMSAVKCGQSPVGTDVCEILYAT